MKNKTYRIALLGGEGMLGTDVAKFCRDAGLDVNVFDLPAFDITDVDQLKSAATGHDIIINCAAYTNVEKAESQADLAYKVNAEAVGLLGEIAKQTDCPVLHISTDFVFDGRLERPYVETDAANPINVYGASKLKGEELLIESGCRYCIIRVQWTYGRAGNNFVKKLIERARGGDSLSIVDDQLGCPTATVEAARAICELIYDLPAGLFHFAAKGQVSRFGMAEFILDKLGMKVELRACKTSDYVSAAQRPLNSRFNCDKIEGLLKEPIKQWQQPLEKFLETL